MTLGELAYVLDVHPRWIQNTAAVLGRTLPYTLASARRLAVTRALAEAVAMPLPRAWQVAVGLLKRYQLDPALAPVPITEGDLPVYAEVDVHRIMSAVHVGVSRLRTGHAPRRRGRPAARRDPLRRASEYGLDLTLLESNLRRTPGERLRQLDAMAAFARDVRRVRR